MKLSYSDSVKPFLHKPGSAYTRALDPHLLACTEKISQKALGSYDGPLAREPWDRDLNRLYKWQELGQQKREVILLQIWQTIHEGLEKASYVMAPTEIPEWDLEKLASANGLRMLELVALTRAPPAFDPATDPVPHFSHGDWDRLWCVGKHGPAVPFSCAKRAFTESAVALRSATLLNFVQVWKMVVDTGVTPQFSLHCPPSAINSSTAPIMHETDNSSNLRFRATTAKVALTTTRCEYRPCSKSGGR